LDDDARQTRSGAVMGTPSYMAPEQARGETDRVTALADVYALGAILYECLSGRPPFKAATVHETLRQGIEEEAVSPRGLDPAVPRDLETVCLKCLHKEPSRRYAGAAELAEDLWRFQEGRLVVARPVGRVERAWRWCRRNRAVAALIVVLVVGVAVSTALAL